MSALEEYVSKIKTGKKAPQVWERPSLKDFEHDLQVLSIDQSLGSAGWVRLRVWETWVEVIAKGTLRPLSDEEGFIRTYALAYELRDMLSLTFRYRAVGRIVFEMPTVQGNRTESSLMAGYAVWDWAIRERSITPCMISIQHSRTVLAGPKTGNDKKAGHEALAHYIPESITRKWNEHTRDAALNGLAYLHDLRREQDERR